MNILLKLLALERMACEEIDKDKLQFERRKEIMNQLLTHVNDLKLDHANTAFDQTIGKQNYIVSDADLVVKNAGCFFRSIIANLNQVADKDSFIEYMTGVGFSKQLLTIATKNDSFIKGTNTLQIFNKLFSEINENHSGEGEIDVKENINEIKSDDEDGVLLDDSDTHFKSDGHIDLFVESLPKLTSVLESNTCKFSQIFRLSLTRCRQIFCIGNR